MAPRFNHLVVLMLENRSFDHMLGRLYHHDNPDPYHIIPRGQVFDGVSDDMFNSVFAFPGPDLPPGAVNAHRTTNFKTPAQFDIGHSFDNVKLQINGALPPSSHMDGFIASRLADLKAAQPHHTATQTEMAEPMAGFSPTTHTATGAGPFADARVICSLAQNFAVCDNWHASVPGPTFPNRSFLHAGTSNGFVSNGSKTNNTIAKWSQHHAPTIFNRMKDAGLSAKIYHGGGGPTGFPALVYELHPPITRAAFPPNSFNGDFLADAKGTDKRKLPEYSFIEPDVIGSDTNWNPNDQHPARDIRWGEDLIQQVYQALSTGPFWDDTLLIITYDEHGGFFDHRYPPAAIPPSLLQLGEENFAFTQAGVRIPAVLVSPRIEAGTVFHPTCPVDHTSVIRTICARWNLPPLTLRDAAACDLSAVLGDSIRKDVPTIAKVDLSNANVETLPLNDLQQDYLALVAANRGVELPHMETEDHARAFLATVANKPPKAAG
jgi:phospholipase C